MISVNEFYLSILFLGDRRNMPPKRRAEDAGRKSKKSRSKKAADESDEEEDTRPIDEPKFDMSLFADFVRYCI